MSRVFPILALLLAACSAPTADTPVVAVDEHNSRNSVDWMGTYLGTLPCADCAGIETTVTLRANGSFTRESVYVGRSAEPVFETGTFTWDDAGQIVLLDPETGPGQQYFVGENVLFQLDRNGQRITGDLADRYRLRKRTAR